MQKTKKDFLKYHKLPPTTFLFDISSGKGKPDKKFDIVFLNGVIGIFDCLKNPFFHLVSLIEDGGVGYIWAGLNPFPIDVIVRGKKFGEQYWESGWNMWSKQTVLEELKKLGYSCNFYDDFEIGIDLPQQEDYLRTWTFKKENGQRVIINGLGLVHSFVLVEIFKN